MISNAGTDTFITTVIAPPVVTTTNFFVGFLILECWSVPSRASTKPHHLPNRSGMSYGSARYS